MTNFAANVFFYEKRKDHLAKLTAICDSIEGFPLDYTAESLLDIELLYREIEKKEKWSIFQTSKEEFEEMMFVYFGEVVIESLTGAEWVIAEHPLLQGEQVMGIEYNAYAIYATAGFEDLNDQPLHHLFYEYERFTRRKAI
ncbi:hypothetical protein ACU3L3_19855 [Priestia endophytica]|uniref:Cyclic nucleotide-binding domain-containing protein n=1 Tax=Priestia endophytica DSM 13796 TaxID=1121089 RepID=A0A1I5YEL3_9BACI|nr:hypothetical protein [Priestia endophytica]KAB2490309.1 hypothetical protein F8155_21070 [Priestia endophytica]KYG31705.1 hypothetical protein AZF06_08195 [Priestia endophytica]MBG9811438.1 hypothetical protein [Priestia endophytica]MCM3537158.1 hypothetical protein [Priestia endophytica]RAS84711.1 hypothetical protein A4R27_05060 [Priestia endophytica]